MLKLRIPSLWFVSPLWRRSSRSSGEFLHSWVSMCCFRQFPHNSRAAQRQQGTIPGSTSIPPGRYRLRRAEQRAI